MSTLGNFVELVAGRPKALRFSMLYFEDREVKDSASGLPKQARALVGAVTYEDGLPVAKMFSTLSARLASRLAAYMADPTLPQRTFTILKSGAGFGTEYGVTIS